MCRGGRSLYRLYSDKVSHCGVKRITMCAPGRQTSSTTLCALLPESLISATADASASARRAASVTWAPLLARTRAKWRPNPLDPPVIACRRFQTRKAPAGCRWGRCQPFFDANSNVCVMLARLLEGVGGSKLACPFLLLFRPYHSRASGIKNVRFNRGVVVRHEPR